jgi:hypothetical protein
MSDHVQLKVNDKLLKIVVGEKRKDDVGSLELLFSSDPNLCHAG